MVFYAFGMAMKKAHLVMSHQLFLPCNAEYRQMDHMIQTVRWCTTAIKSSKVMACIFLGLVGSCVRDSTLESGAITEVLPSGDQTWRWKMDRLEVIFPLKAPFIGDFHCHV